MHPHCVATVELLGRGTLQFEPLFMPSPYSWLNHGTLRVSGVTRDGVRVTTAPVSSAALGRCDFELWTAWKSSVGGTDTSHAEWKALRLAELTRVAEKHGRTLGVVEHGLVSYARLAAKLRILEACTRVRIGALLEETAHVFELHVAYGMAMQLERQPGPPCTFDVVLLAMDPTPNEAGQCLLRSLARPVADTTLSGIVCAVASLLSVPVAHVRDAFVVQHLGGDWPNEPLDNACVAGSVIDCDRADVMMGMRVQRLLFSSPVICAVCTRPVRRSANPGGMVPLECALEVCAPCSVVHSGLELRMWDGTALKVCRRAMRARRLEPRAWCVGPVRVVDAPRHVAGALLDACALAVAVLLAHQRGGRKRKCGSLADGIRSLPAGVLVAVARRMLELAQPTAE
jgi:hypothetical protein